MDELPELTMEDVLYWMGWIMDSQRRMYDVQLAMLSALAEPAKAKQLQALHEEGRFLYPPVYVEDPDDNGTNQTTT
jgi:hypothetical protein